MASSQGSLQEIQHPRSIPWVRRLTMHMYNVIILCNVSMMNSLDYLYNIDLV